jgi:hypothetical protein
MFASGAAAHRAGDEGLRAKVNATVGAEPSTATLARDMTLLRSSFAFLLVSFALIAPASAQTTTTVTTGRCGMSETDISYDGLSVGSVVTLQRHRFVHGDDNWDPLMTRFIGREARITQMSGLDAQGCAGVRVDTDGGSWFWRARDLGVGTAAVRPPASSSASMAFPQECGMSAARYGSATVGAAVILGRHRPVNGDTYWAPDMDVYVGRRARVTSFSGLDSQGCPCVRVDADGGTYYWRIRDFRSPTGETTAAPIDDYVYTPSAGITTDHGRPVATAAVIPTPGEGMFGVGGVPGPQACGLTDTTVDWAGIRVGSSVTLGRHRAVEGVDNWDALMDPYVGVTSRVTTLIGVDDQGCPVVFVEASGTSFFWRVRDLTVEPATAEVVANDRPGAWRGIRGLIPTACGLASGTENYGPIGIGTRVVLGRHVPYSGPDAYGGVATDDTDWAFDMEPYVGQVATVTQLAGTDSAGCAGVRVDLDGSSWFWRIRDMQLAP